MPSPYLLFQWPLKSLTFDEIFKIALNSLMRDIQNFLTNLIRSDLILFFFVSLNGWRKSSTVDFHKFTGISSKHTSSTAHKVLQRILLKLRRIFENEKFKRCIICDFCKFVKLRNISFESDFFLLALFLSCSLGWRRSQLI